MIIETCPKCGHDLEETVLTTNPPILVKRCLHCGWRWEWGQENITRIPFQDRIVKDINVPIKTNADRIRAMTDEALASFLCTISNCCVGNCLGEKHCSFDNGNGYLEWLKKEVKDGT